MAHLSSFSSFLDLLIPTAVTIYNAGTLDVFDFAAGQIWPNIVDEIESRVEREP
ncbi:hypothetical protein BDZ89DRAFT_1057590, partial [Hymenopellis radicata]